jgi:hypothetical protein
MNRLHHEYDIRHTPAPSSRSLSGRCGRRWNLCGRDERIRVSEREET